MNRREFILRAIYTSLALSFAACVQTTTATSSNRLRAPQRLNHRKGQIDIQTAQLHIIGATATQIWQYQDPTGGAMLDVMEGERVQLTLNNHLPEATTVHWHGMDIPVDQDGLPHRPIAPNQSFDVDFIAPKAGTYWYHPHPHQRTAFQAAQGLAAPIIVRSANDPLTAAGINEHILLFSAPQLDEQGQIAAHTMDEQMNGREGNVLLINGQVLPTLEVTTGSMHRLRIINATNARYLRLAFTNTTLTVVGTDGGLLEKPLAPQQELLIAPAERYEICVTFDASSTLQALPYDKGWMDGGMGMQKPILKTVDAMHIKTTGARSTPPQLPATLNTIEPLGKAKVTRRMVLTENMQMSMAGGKHSMTMEFMINNRMFDMQRTDFSAKVGEVELWEIDNQTDMDHPFHVHGSHFQVVSIDGQPAPYLAWKDTINTRAKQKIQIKIAQRHKGLRMYHCHILEHEDLGMMGQYDVL